MTAIDEEGLLVLAGAGPVGSAGAPCFNKNLELVGMIATLLGDEARCAPIASIARRSRIMVCSGR